ncbi:hypothetical protein Y032_0079g1247 [Ancylostoma ceylanicum]|uniref:Pyridoxal-dependent decarboxylase domain protein n=2 Tax=Ancylostoma ceylanicum TaxID=53326 RepID=A0A016TS77_9BILA|nr:hypothetical protein Y032_0079g1247 [Ancylostoma ceylanicum]
MSAAKVSSRSTPSMEQRVSQRSSARGGPPSTSTAKPAGPPANAAKPANAAAPAAPGESTTDKISEYAIIALVAIQNACISIKNFLYNVYLVLKFVWQKPDVAWDLVSTTCHLIKVSRDAGLWSWSQLWDMFYAQTFAPMINQQKAKEEAEAQKAKTTIIVIYTITLPAFSSKTITAVTVENANDPVFDTILYILTHEFGVRLKVIPPYSDRCSSYTKFSRKYAPISGQSIVLFIRDDEERIACRRGGEGNALVVQLPNATASQNMIHTIKYGDITKSKENDTTGNVYNLVQDLHRITTVSSDSHVPYHETGILKAKKPPSGVVVPGFVALAFSLGTVLAFAISVRMYMNYHKKSSAISMNLFDFDDSMKNSQLKGSSEKSKKHDSRSKKRKKKEPTEEEINKLRSESWRESYKAGTKETLEELAPIISKGRNIEDVLDNPVNGPEFLFYLHRLTRLAIEYFDDPSAFSVTSDLNPGFLYRTMTRFAPPNPDSFSVICEDLKKKILPGMTHWQHPRFYAYFPAGRRYPDVLAELLTSAMAFNVFSWESCPSLNELEHTVVNWIGRAFGLPESFLFQESLQKSTGGGSIVGSASDAIFCSVLVSRNWKIKQVKARQQGLGKSEYETTHDILKKLVVYCSKDAHSGIEKACKVAMVRCRPIQPLEENGWGITGAQLEKCIIKDMQNGLIPTHIHCTLGTSSTGADDKLDSIWPIAEKYEMWIHCDASYSGNAWIDEKYRGNATALAHVHSLNVNLRKFLLFSGMTCLVWTRLRHVYKEAFTTATFQRLPMQDTTDMRDWGIHVSRRNKALKIWMSVRLNGLEGLRYHLNNSVEMCIYFESMVATHPLLRIFSRRLALFTFYYEEPGSSKEENNKYTEDLCQFINQSHKLFLALTKVHDINLIRVSISYERINKSVIEESWNILKNLVDEFTNRKSSLYKLS